MVNRAARVELRWGGPNRDPIHLLQRFNRERGQTLVLVKHDQEVGEFCNRIIHMRDGLIETQAA